VVWVDVVEVVGHDHLGPDPVQQVGDGPRGERVEDDEVGAEDRGAAFGLGETLGFTARDGDGDRGVAGVEGEGAAGPQLGVVGVGHHGQQRPG